MKEKNCAKKLKNKKIEINYKEISQNGIKKQILKKNFRLMRSDKI